MPPIPRRHIALALIGALHVGIGLRLALSAISPGDPDLAIWHELLPPWLRVALWSLAGLLCLVFALSDATERSGWVIAILMPMERTASYAWSVLMWVIPGWPPGAVGSLGGAGFWAAVTCLIWLMAGWPEQREGRA